jgi:hypothetical protein
MPVLADLFLVCRWLISNWLWIFGWWFLGVRGLTCVVAGFLRVWVGFWEIRAKGNDNIQSLRPSDYAPAFGRAVAAVRRLLLARLVSGPSGFGFCYGIMVLR